ncbi:hypothetical protein, partial [Aeromonas veronii]|uniref:hypothetical protein n=1 Tax=Aeromonas veronii TaxID=654 RepID=UPI003D1B4210
VGMGMLLNRLVKRDSTRPTLSSDHATFLFIIYQQVSLHQFPLNAHGCNKLRNVITLTGKTDLFSNFIYVMSKLLR